MRKSFIMYTDSLGVLKQLTDEQAGQLFKAIAGYAEGQEVALDGLMGAVFFNFQNQLDRDIEKYKAVCERNKANGKKGGRPKTQPNPENPDGFSGNPKNLDTDTDTDTESDKDKVSNPPTPQGGLVLFAEPPPSKPKSGKKKFVMPPEYADDFAWFWKEWAPFEMVKGDKLIAEEKYAAARREVSAQAIESAAMAYLKSCHATRTKTKHVSSWLNQRGWEGEYDTPSTNQGGLNNGRQSKADAANQAGNMALASLGYRLDDQGGCGAVLQLLPPIR